MKDSTGTGGDSIEYHIKVGTCKTCKWWDGLNECSNLKVLDMIYALDASLIGFKPPPDFGCIHHEPKITLDII